MNELSLLSDKRKAEKIKVHKMKISTNKTRTIIFSAILVFVLFLIWLCGFSSSFPIGTPELTRQFRPNWSPDEKYVVFECHYVYPFDGYDIISWDSLDWDTKTGEVCLFNVERRELERLTYGRYKSYPVWSPDGTHLIWDENGHLIVFNIQTQEIDSTLYELRQYWYQYKNSHSLEKLNISPDGKYSIQFLEKSETEDHTKQELVFTHLPSMDMISISFPNLISSVTWFPDGETIAFQSENTVGIFTFQFEENPFSYMILEKKEIVLNGIVDEEIILSPTGRYITYISNEIVESIDETSWKSLPRIWMFDLTTNIQYPLVPID